MAGAGDVYGMGAVDSAGKQVIPNPGVGIYEFTGAMIKPVIIRRPTGHHRAVLEAEVAVALVVVEVVLAVEAAVAAQTAVAVAPVVPAVVAAATSAAVVLAIPWIRRPVFLFIPTATWR